MPLNFVPKHSMPHAIDEVKACLEYKTSGEVS